MAAEPTNDTILSELVALARDPARGLLQFRSLAGAHQYRELYRLWRLHVPEGAEALDWGAGNGHFSYFLVRAGYRATGFSFLPCGYAAWLPPEPPYRFVPGSERDPVHLPFADASFDAVASVGVLEHVRETDGNEPASLAEIARVLRPGGVFACWHLPNRWSWIDWAARIAGGRYVHTWRYTPGDIRALLAGAGLELLERRRYGMLPRNTMHRLFGSASAAGWTAALWDALDAGLGVPLGVFAQNHGFIARKPPTPR